MRFKALVYKELRECLPYIIGAALLFFVCGFVAMQIAINPESNTYRFPTFTPGEHDAYNWRNQLFQTSYIQPAGAFLLAFSAALGIALGIRQYRGESNARTWGFLLHHSVNRGTILISKLFIAALSFLPLLIIWSIFYAYAHDTRYFPIPPIREIFIEGLMFTAFGYVVYLSLAMASMNKAKWYTTKKISIAFGIWMFINLVVQWKLYLGWLTIIIASLILLIQLTDTFLNREFE